ncbi:amidohydrolase [Azospirillum lipoferum]|uniref:Amidohydrolase n=2 Tax=Azospirillaceae TaxID=2829815 RepID=A0A5A9GFH3_AZOLI|nr:amidohydrolase [Azospirillum lipoferum]
MTGSFHRCDRCAHENDHPIVRRNGQSLVVDIHCHLAVRRADARLREVLPDAPAAMPFTSPASQAVNGSMFAAIASRLHGTEERLADMDRLGIDVQAISPSPGQYFYFTPPELGRELSRMVNDGLAEAVSSHPDRFVALGTVPLQNTGMAIAEMRRCVTELGFRGVEINSNVNGRELADAEFRPFFAAAEELGILVFLHPLGFTHGERLTDHYLNNIIGNPLEATIALSHLIFGGVLDSHPGLKLCVAHGGGYLPSYWGRMDHAWRVRPECRAHIAHEPSHYLRQVWLDTLVFDRSQLDALLRVHGPERLCLGTDYPFDMAEPDPLAFHAGLEPEVRDRILGLNAARLLGLQTDRSA